MSKHRVLGVDYSLTSTGLVMFPAGWFPEWKYTEHATVKSEAVKTEQQRVARYRAIAKQIRDYAWDWGVTHVVFEQHAFGKNTAQGYRIVEGTGVAKAALLASRIKVLEPVVVGQARKLLLGANPRVDPKGFVEECFKRLDGPFKNQDESDAGALANWGLSELGCGGVIIG